MTTEKRIFIANIQSNLTNKEFMDLSEEQGTVYSLEGFMQAWNTHALPNNNNIYTKMLITDVKID